MTSDDHLLAAEVADAAGNLLVDLRAALAAHKASAEELRAEGDSRAHELIVSRLHAARPDDAILSEEGKDDRARLAAERVWIVDPLDGTREFGEPPRTDWAVHVALVVEGKPVAGAVALPALGATLVSDPPPPAPGPSDGPIRIMASRTRPGLAAEQLADALGETELIFLGSAGAKAMAVVRGEADIYAHTGGQYEWDSCAPVAVALAAGLHASRLDGSPLVYNNADPYLPDLVICRAELADPVLDILRG